MNPNYLDFEQPIAELEAKIEGLKLVGSGTGLNISEEITRLGDKSLKLTEEIFSNLSAWQVSRWWRPSLGWSRRWVPGWRTRSIGASCRRPSVSFC